MRFTFPPPFLRHFSLRADPLTSSPMTTAIMNTFDPSDLSTLKACRALAAEVFGGKEWAREGGEARVYDKGEAVTSWAIGNCHVRCFLPGSARTATSQVIWV